MTSEPVDEQIHACLVNLRGLMRASGKSYYRMTFNNGSQEDSITVSRCDGEDPFYEDVIANEGLGSTHAFLFPQEEP